MKWFNIDLTNPNLDQKDVHTVDFPSFWDYVTLYLLCFPWFSIGVGTHEPAIGAWTVVLLVTLIFLMHDICHLIHQFGQGPADLLKFELLCIVMGLTYGFCSGLVSFVTFCIVRDIWSLFTLNAHAFRIEHLPIGAGLVIGMLTFASTLSGWLFSSLYWKRRKRANRNQCKRSDFGRCSR
ncbi:MAG TPA: hypothetical protein PKE58_09435 [Acidobacteriota bacterium]|nr:hypothetical protein [Acidobacteriota bacterium]